MFLVRCMCQETLAIDRRFDCLVNDVVFAANVNVYSSAMNSVYKPIEFSTNASTVDASGALNITLSKSALSSTPPIWNALEVFSIHPKSLATLAGDGTQLISHITSACRIQVSKRIIALVEMQVPASPMFIWSCVLASCVTSEHLNNFRRKLRQFGMMNMNVVAWSFSLQQCRHLVSYYVILW